MAQATRNIVAGLEPIHPRPEMPRTAFWPGLVVSPDLDLVYFSGFTAHPIGIDPWNPGTFTLPAEVDAQQKMMTDNVDRMLTAADTTWQHIIMIVRYTAEAGGGSHMAAKLAGWNPCSTSLRVNDTGIPGAKVLNQITAVAPRRGQAASRIEPILPQEQVMLQGVSFAPGLKVSSNLDLVYFSGITAYPPEVDPWNPGSFTLPADLDSQNRMLAENVDRMLKTAGVTWQDIILIDRHATDAGGRDYLSERLGDWRPCGTWIGVADTGVPGARVVLEITAAAPRQT